MIVFIVRCDTFVGNVVHEFDSIFQTAYWIRLCTSNKVKFTLDCRFEDRPKQYEFPF